MSYHHLSTFECARIEVLLKISVRQIAEQLNLHHSKIPKELNYNATNTH